jgi:hypothetical protein
MHSDDLEWGGISEEKFSSLRALRTLRLKSEFDPVNGELRKSGTRSFDHSEKHLRFPLSVTQRNRLNLIPDRFLIS